MKDIKEYTSLEQITILETLSDAINAGDDAGLYHIGDELLTLIQDLKVTWGYSEEDII